MKLLIVEDHPHLRKNLLFLLKKHGHFGEGASNGTQALQKISQGKYDAIILDLEMPEMDGKTCMKELKKINNPPPVIVLTSYSQLQDKLDLFQLGAQDYITKPVEIEELLARLNIIVQRATSKNVGTQLMYKDILLDTLQGKVSKNGIHITLPHKQFLILEYLLRHKGYPQKKSCIMEYVWGESEEKLDLSSTTLESHIYALRKKLGENIIHTLKGFGYIID